MIGIIYKVTHKLDGASYIGQTIQTLDKTSKKVTKLHETDKSYN